MKNDSPSDLKAGPEIKDGTQQQQAMPSKDSVDQAAEVVPYFSLENPLKEVFVD
jgi:hypothetical protein